MGSDDLHELERILGDRLITPVYQPIVQLQSGFVVGYEALARGPKGSPLEGPAALFDTARENGFLRQLDWLCRTNAVDGALDGRLQPPFSLFINSEPDTLGSKVSADFAESWARARLAGLKLIFEVTERAVLDRPAELLRAMQQIRSFGWGVALDDVGRDPASLALLPFIKPDVIKLDMSLLHGTAPDVTEVILAVNAEAERSGALVLAEGIEKGEHLDVAHTFGATLGQGWFFGRPEAIPRPLPEAGRPIQVADDVRTGLDAGTPFPIASEKVPPRRATRKQLVDLSRLIEKRAAELPHPPVLVGAFQWSDRFSGKTQEIYEELAQRLPFVGALARLFENGKVNGIRCIALEEDDPLTNEWAVGLVTPYSALLLSALERDEGTNERFFDFSLTFDRDTAIRGIRVLMGRLEIPDPEPLEGEDLEFAEAVTRVLKDVAEEEDIVRPLLRVMAEMTGLQSTFLSRIRDSSVYDIVVAQNVGESLVEDGYSTAWTRTVCYEALQASRNWYEDVQNELEDNEVVSEFGFHTYVTCPVLNRDGTVVGTLCGASRQVTPLTDEQVEMVRRFARMVAARIADRKA